jgi:hypothetical protein
MDTQHAWDRGNASTTLAGKPEERDYMKDNSKNNIKRYIIYIRCGNVNWVYLAQERVQKRTLMNTVMNLRVL